MCTFKCITARPDLEKARITLISFTPACNPIRAACSHQTGTRKKISAQTVYISVTSTFPLRTNLAYLHILREKWCAKNFHKEIAYLICSFVLVIWISRYRHGLNEAFEHGSRMERKKLTDQRHSDSKRGKKRRHMVPPYEQFCLLRVDYFPRRWFLNLGLRCFVQAHPPESAFRLIFLPLVLLLIVLTSMEDTVLMLLTQMVLLHFWTINKQHSGKSHYFSFS